MNKVLFLDDEEISQLKEMMTLLLTNNYVLDDTDQYHFNELLADLFIKIVASASSVGF